MTNCAGACEQKLKTKLDIARSILSIAELIKTDRERLVNPLPFYDTSMNADIQNINNEIQLELSQARGRGGHNSASVESSSNKDTKNDSQLAFTDKLLRNKEKLHGFYKMYNNTLLESVEVERERDRLQLENQQLNTLISQYNKAKTIDANSLNTANTLLIVNGR